MAEGRAAARVAGPVIVVALFAVTAAVLVRPWTVPDGLPDVPVARYLAATDGSAALGQVSTGDGTPSGWRSVSAEVVPGFRAELDLPASFRLTLNKAVGIGPSTSSSRVRSILSKVVVLRDRIREVDASGAVGYRRQLALLTAKGLLFMGLEDTGQGEAVFDPPALELPADPHAGSQWNTTGKFQAADYSWKASVTADGSIDSGFGRLSDCLTVATTFATSSSTTFTDHYCRGYGDVDSTTAGTPGSVVRIVASTTHPGFGPTARPPEPAPPAAAPASDVATWNLARVGRVAAVEQFGTGTWSPVYLPGSPPELLASTADDKAVFAMSAGGVSPGSVVWSFATGGVVFGRPTVDPVHGRVFVGSSAKRIYALDTRGLFLWSASTDDNVAASPVVSGDTVVVAGEDGHVYAFDAATGRHRWAFHGSEAFASSPVVVDGVVVVAGDSGIVYGLDVRDGSQLWSYDASSPVGADLAASDADVLVPTSDGFLFRLVAKTGKVQWAFSAVDSLNVGATPLAAGAAAIVDASGGLTELNRDGFRQWRIAGRGYAGAALRVGTDLVVARRDGRVDAVDSRGHVVRSWDAHTVTVGTDAAPKFAVGASAGEARVWLIDEDSTLFQLGPTDPTAVTSLGVEWTKFNGPLGAGLLATTPQPWNGGLVEVSTDLGVYLFGASGKAVRLGTLSAAGTVFSAPVIVGDRLVIVLQQNASGAGDVAAFDLQTGTTAWAAPHTGNAYQSPVVLGTNVVVSTGDASGSSLMALDLATGKPVWVVAGPLNAVGTISLPPAGAASARGVAVGGVPVGGFDQSGKLLWSSAVTAPAGAPVMDPSGAVAYVASYEPDAVSGRVTALDTATGAVLWSAALKNFLPSPRGAPAVVDGVVVVTSTGTGLAGLDAQTGATKWAVNLPAVPLGLASGIGGKVALALEDTSVLFLDPASGAVVASAAGLGEGRGESGVAQQPAPIDGVVVVASGAVIYAIKVSPE